MHAKKWKAKNAKCKFKKKQLLWTLALIPLDSVPNMYLKTL